eukprot:jgi/Picsp_1/5870/NSC_03228-R1_---NA---
MRDGILAGGVFSVAGLAACCVASVVMLLFERRKTARRVDKLEEQLYIALTELELMKVDMEDSKQREVRETRRLSSGSLCGGTVGTPEYPTKHLIGAADLGSQGNLSESLGMHDTTHGASDHEDEDCKSDTEVIAIDDGLCGVDVEILRMSARGDDMEDNWLLHVPGRSIEIAEKKKVEGQKERNVVPKLNLSACDHQSWK